MNTISFALLFLAVSMGSGQIDEPSVQPEKNRVIVMGMIHGKHLTDKSYSLEKVKNIIRSVRPDIVLTEIPPDRLEAATQQFELNSKISEPRVARFPEYVDALFPLTREMDFQIVPCAAWTKSMNDRRRATMEKLKESHSQQYAEMEAAQANANEEISQLGSVNDPEVIHTDAYDEIVRKGMEPYDRHFNELIGDGGWTNINKSHYALIENALNSITGQGKTILITFGSWHKYYIKDQLKKRNDIELVSQQNFLTKELSGMTDWPQFRLSTDHSGSFGETEISEPEVAWKYDTGDIIESSPAVVGDSVYIGGHSKKLVALERATGKKKWQYETSGWVRASPSVVDGVVYFGSDDNKFYALDAKTGKKRWDFELGEGGEQSSPAIANGIVYFGAFDNFVYALDAKSGKSKWKFDAGASMLSSPALNATAVFIATYAGKVFSVDRNTGKEIWQFHPNDKPMFSSPVCRGEKVFITSYDHHIYCLNTSDGKMIWRCKTGDEIFSSPAIVDNVLYSGSNDHFLYALDTSNGQIKWKANLNGAVFASPTVSRASVYVGSSDGYFYCIDRESGEQRWRYLVKEGARVWSSAAAVDGRLYFGSHAGELVVLHEKR